MPGRSWSWYVSQNSGDPKTGDPKMVLVLLVSLQTKYKSVPSQKSTPARAHGCTSLAEAPARRSCGRWPPRKRFPPGTPRRPGSSPKKTSSVKKREKPSTREVPETPDKRKTLRSLGSYTALLVPCRRTESILDLLAPIYSSGAIRVVPTALLWLLVLQLMQPDGRQCK